MRLQRFKTATAQAVIGDENRSMLSMATDQLIDLLSLDAPEKGAAASESKEEAGEKKQWNLPELWDMGQYDEAFDLDSFVGSLR